MDNQAFITAYNESRNGANSFLFNPMYRQMQYSDGVRDCAEAGCCWLLDIIGTECLKPLRESGDGFGVIVVKVAGSEADIGMTIWDDDPPIWSRQIEYTDMPNGDWTFFLVDEGERFALILPSEY